MKLLLNLSFAFITLSINGFAEGEAIQKQISKDIFLRYDDMQQKVEGDKREVIFKNPHFLWMDRFSITPGILAEADLKGNLILTSDSKNNQLKSETDGSTRLKINLTRENENPLDITIDGKMTKLLNIDMATANKTLADLKTEGVSKETVLKFLEAIKSASSEGRNLKIIDNTDPTAPPYIVDLVKLDYLHSTGATPEQINFKISGVHTLDFPGTDLSTIYTWPSIGPINSSTDLSLNLPPWRQLELFTQEPKLHKIPPASIEMKNNSKSKLGSGDWNLAFNSKDLEGDEAVISVKSYANIKLASDWVKDIQNVKIEKNPNPPANVSTEENIQEAAFVQSYMNWLQSPKTTAFLSLIPLEVTKDASAFMRYGKDNSKFSFKDYGLQLSLVGKDKNGLLVMLGRESHNPSSIIKGVVTVVGGKSTYDYAISLYNSFRDSVSDDWEFPKISDATRENFYKILLGYTEQPDKANNEVKFNINYNDQGLTIGGKGFTQLLMDYARFRVELSKP